MYVAKARRFIEIVQRNQIRREAGLPLLAVAAEWRRMKELEDRQAFEQFAAVHAQAVLDDLLKRRRETEGNPNWRPSWMEGVRYQTRVNKILREKFWAARGVQYLVYGVDTKIIFDGCTEALRALRGS